MEQPESISHSDKYEVPFVVVVVCVLAFLFAIFAQCRLRGDGLDLTSVVFALLVIGVGVGVSVGGVLSGSGLVVLLFTVCLDL